MNSGRYNLISKSVLEINSLEGAVNAFPNAFEPANAVQILLQKLSLFCITRNFQNHRPECHQDCLFCCDGGHFRHNVMTSRQFDVMTL